MAGERAKSGEVSLLKRVTLTCHWGKIARNLIRATSNLRSADSIQGKSAEFALAWISLGDRAIC